MEDDLSQWKQKYLDAVTEIQRLTSVIENLQQQLQESLKGNDEQRKTLTDLETKIDKLIAQTKRRNKRDYGKKTENHNPRPAAVTPKQKTEKAPDAPDDERATGIKHILKNAKNVAHDPQTHPVRPEDSICPSCDCDTKFVSNLLTHELEMVSASLKIIEHLQETRACPKCKQYIVTAEKPLPPIPGSYAGSRLLGEIIVGKLDDGLPNNRQEKIFGRHNVTIPRSTQSGWMQATASTLWLLYTRLKKSLFQSDIIKTDDSSIKIQDRKHKNNIRKGKITAYVGDETTRVTMFDFSPDLSFDKNSEFLEPFCGTVQADAAGGFDALFRDGTKTEAGCSAHSRRKYFESGEHDLRSIVLDIYRDLYRIEHEIKDKAAAIRLAMRRRKSKPLIKQLRKNIISAKAILPPTHELMIAINYTLKHWIALTRFLKNPAIAIDNNAA